MNRYPLCRLALCAAFAVAACQPAPSDRSEAESGIPSAPPDSTAPDSSAPDTIPAPPATPAAEAPRLLPDAAKGETGARAVLLDWARGLENGDFATAYAQWGHNGAASGMSEAEYADYWSGLGRLTVAVPEGRMEGAAGSLYYEVPTTITARKADGGTVEFTGTVVLRRVNDVPGATADQLRWHIESADLAQQ